MPDEMRARLRRFLLDQLGAPFLTRIGACPF
jgi:hypothetical protein